MGTRHRTHTLADVLERLPAADGAVLRRLTVELNLGITAPIETAMHRAADAPDVTAVYLMAALCHCSGLPAEIPATDRTHRGAISAAGAPASPGSGIPPGHAPAAPSPEPAVQPAADPPPEESPAEAAVTFLTDVVGLTRADAASMTVRRNLGVPERYRAESAASAARADAAARHDVVGDGGTASCLEPGERLLLLQTGLHEDHLADYERDLLATPDTHTLAGFPEQAAGPAGLSRAEAEALADAGWQERDLEAYRQTLARTPAVEVRHLAVGDGPAFLQVPA